MLLPIPYSLEPNLEKFVAMSENAFQKLGLKDDFEIVLIQKPTYPFLPGEKVAIASKELVGNCKPKEIYMSHRTQSSHNQHEAVLRMANREEGAEQKAGQQRAKQRIVDTPVGCGFVEVSKDQTEAGGERE